MKRYIKRTWHWFVLLLLTDIAFLFSTWIIRQDAMEYMAWFYIMFSVLVFLVGFFIELHKQRKEERMLLEFLEVPDEQKKKELLEYFDNSNVVEQFCRKLISMEERMNEKTVELSEYREYIEEWVHEAKTPLSLFTLVMNNHKSEMSSYVYTRLHYAQHQISENVERILFYARLQAEHPDIKYMPFRLDECVLEMLEEYQPFVEEKNICLISDLEALEVVSDRKIVSFLMAQLMGNAVKYADEKAGKIKIALWRKQDEVHLHIWNNGKGVPVEDLPFLFDKGFTGNYPNRQKATGMGLYLVQKYAKKLCVKVRLDTDFPCESGFGIKLIFVL